MLNPFGEDDDDFEVNDYIDENLKLSYLIVDHMHNEHPELLKDQYWDAIPKSLPDKAKEVKAEDSESPKELTDTGNYEEKKTSTTRQSKDDLPTEKDALKDSRDPSNKQSVHPDQVPNRFIIDEIYFKFPDVEKKQSELEREMERTRRKSILDSAHGSSKSSGKHSRKSSKDSSRKQSRTSMN